MSPSSVTARPLRRGVERSGADTRPAGRAMVGVLLIQRDRRGGATLLTTAAHPGIASVMVSDALHAAIWVSQSSRIDVPLR